MIPGFDEFIVHVDMDDTMCDYTGPWTASRRDGVEWPQSVPGFYEGLEPLPGAVDAFRRLSEAHDVWILTRPSYMNPHCYTEKRLWVERHLGLEACRRLILAPDKGLVAGDVLVDDHPWPGFRGRQILFDGDWDAVLADLLDSP